jgi:hypothetical protein
MYRVDPQLPTRAYDTYGIVQPSASHTRPAKCSEVECDAYKYGWRTVLDLSTSQGVEQASYIYYHSGRHYKAEQNENRLTLTFSAGQECFAEHRVSIQREPLYVVRHGDWRSHGPARQVPGEQWVNELGTNQNELKKQLDRG